MYPNPGTFQEVPRNSVLNSISTGTNALQYLEHLYLRDHLSEQEQTDGVDGEPSAVGAKNNVKTGKTSELAESSKFQIYVPPMRAGQESSE